MRFVRSCDPHVPKQVQRVWDACGWQDSRWHDEPLGSTLSFASHNLFCPDVQLALRSVVVGRLASKQALSSELLMIAGVSGCVLAMKASSCSLPHPMV